ncbi:MAG: hypothetical protein EBS06_08660, partial [Proteobacteria bacterium]|nr:hypothetical protein [Pseudomonadota bacterium]
VQTNDANLLSQSSDSYQLGFGSAARTSGNISSTLLQNASIKGGAINITAANDFTNLAASISTSKNTTSDSSSGVSSVSSGDLNILAGNNVNISTLQLHNRSESRWGSGKKGGVSITDSVTNLSSDINVAGSLTASAVSDSGSNSSGGNINITGSSLTSADNLTLTAQNDVTIQSAQDTTYNFSAGRLGRGKSYLNQSSSTTQIESDLTTTNNGNISITSGYNNTDTIGATDAKGSINILASKLTTSDTDNNTSNNTGSGNITLAAKEDLVIASELNTTYSEKLSGKKSFSTTRENLSIDSESINVSSEITGNNITTSSGNNTYIIASNLTGSGSGSLIAGKYVDPNDSTNISYNSNATMNIISAADEKFHYAMSQKISTDYKAVAVATVAAVAGTVATGGTGALVMAGSATSGAMMGAQAKKSKTATEMTYDAVQKSSELKFDGNLKIESGSDTNITSSNLAANQVDINTGKITDQNGDLQTINTEANLNIATIADIHQSESSVKKTHANYGMLAVTSFAVGAASNVAGKAAGNYAGSLGASKLVQFGASVAASKLTNLALEDAALKASMEKSDSSNSSTIKTQKSSEIFATENLNINSANDITISGSNLRTGNGDISVVAGDNVLIQNAMNGFESNASSSNKSFTKKSVNDSGRYKEEIVSSNIASGGNLSIQTNSNNSSENSGNVTIVSSNLSSKGDLALGSFSIATNSDGTYQTDANGNLVTTSSGKINNLFILAAEAKDESWSSSNKSNKLALKSNEQKNYTLDTSLTSSAITSEKNLTINTEGDVNISASNLSSGLNTLINTGGDFNVSSDDETHVSQSSSKEKGFKNFDLKYNRGRLTAGANIGISELTSDLSETSQVASNITSEGSLLVNSLNNANIKSSNIVVKDDLFVLAKNDISVDANSESKSLTTENKSINDRTYVGVGNSYAETYYAVDDVLKAKQALSKAVSNYEDAKKDPAVEGEDLRYYEANVALATTNLYMVTQQAANQAKQAAADSKSAGFYATAGTTLTTNSTKTSSSSTTHIASNLIATDGNITLQSNLGDVNIKGSNLNSFLGDINLTAKNLGNDPSKGNVNILSVENVTTSKSSQNNTTTSIQADVHSSSASVSAIFSALNSDFNSYQLTNINSKLNAENGAINIKSNQDTNIEGAKLLAQNITLNVGNNLNIESKQNISNSKSETNGFTVGGSMSTLGGPSATFGLTKGKSKSDRLWVDDQTSVIGTSSVVINTKENTNLVGAVIANSTNGVIGEGAIDGGNLILNTKSLTFKDLSDHDKSSSYFASVTASIGTSTDQSGNSSVDPSQGSTQIIAKYNKEIIEQKTKASIGRGSIILNSNLTFDSDMNLESATGGEIANSNNSMISGLNRDISNTQEITKHQKIGGLDVNLTLNHQSLANLTTAKGRTQEAENLKYLGKAFYVASPIGVSQLIENYTGRELTWKPGDVARFKEKGREFETSVPGANTIGMANTIDLNDPKDANKLYLIGQPITAYPGYDPGFAREGGTVSKIANPINGMNSMSVFHDKFTEDTFLGAPGLLQLSIIPAIPINYYGLIGKSIRNLYEQPANK